MDQNVSKTDCAGQPFNPVGTLRVNAPELAQSLTHNPELPFHG